MPDKNDQWKEGDPWKPSEGALRRFDPDDNPFVLSKDQNKATNDKATKGKEKAGPAKK